MFVLCDVDLKQDLVNVASALSNTNGNLAAGVGADGSSATNDYFTAIWGPAMTRNSFIQRSFDSGLYCLLETFLLCSHL